MRTDILLAQGREKMQVAGKEGADERWGLLQNNKPQEKPHDTRQIIADRLG